MLCIQCHSNLTCVTNSRPNKKQARVWRRRHCPTCGADFTTQEKPALGATISVLSSKTGLRQPFYQGRLIYSIMRSFLHDEQFGIDSALPLSDTVIATLLPTSSVINSTEIAAACYDILLRFDQSAATQYALTHGMLNTPRRRRKNA